MAIEDGKKPEEETTHLLPKSKLFGQPLVSIRSASLLATITAAVLMGLNKQTRTITVAIVGTTPVLQSFTATFQQTPAFVYFVVANAAASLYNLVLLVLRPLLKPKAHDFLLFLLDMVMFALVATGAATAASMAELGKNGNMHARWNPVCDRFEGFCIRGGLAIVASSIGALLLFIMNAFTASILCKSVKSQN
ncbi:CASP-like protein 1B1 [Canna indica]|uniref:CASP-like protein n=1 Tax=Canna indica TaxID=4628 RepID=A0AAQ3Q5V5_9LILI|nr:CASP-like protein 1B1 [Canna indica]